MFTLHGLSPQLRSFCFRLYNDILPTRERLTRLGKVAGPDCVDCGEPGTNTHLLSCPNNSAVVDPLLACLRSYVPGLSVEQIVFLNFAVEGASIEFPLVYIYLFHYRRTIQH